MEYWVSKSDNDLILTSVKINLNNKDIRVHSAKSSIPTFHYSNNPGHLNLAKSLISHQTLGTRLLVSNNLQGPQGFIRVQPGSH